MKTAYYSMAPIKTGKFNDRKRVPWFNQNVKTQQKLVCNRKEKWLKNKTESAWKAFRCERTRYHNIVNYEETNCISGEVLPAQGDTKKLYQVVNESTSSIKKNPFPVADNDKQLAKEFATFSLEKITNIKRSLEHIPTFHCNQDTSIPILTKFRPLTSKEVHELIGEMKTKSCELDPIPTKIIKEHLDLFLPILTKNVNSSLSNSYFHENWKSAVVRPLLKKMVLEFIKKNYRLVSNLTFVSKLIEKTALKQFIHLCDTYHLLPDYQSAYRNGYSYETSVLKLVKNALWNMENQKITACAFLDLSASFDTVDHELPLHILHNKYGVNGLALKWYENYLRPRNFRVCINKEYSEKQDLGFSIPQGSASSANIFMAYCSLYKDAFPSGLTLQGLADDHLIRNSFIAGNLLDQERQLNEIEFAICETKSWMDVMKLKFNPDKTEFMLFSHQKQLLIVTKNEIIVDSTPIVGADHVKCLGAWLD